jgi:hypothetical protein
VQDKDIIFKGDDGGSAITALTLDMSEAGNASFNGTVTANAGVVVDNITIDGTEIDLSSGNLTIDVAGGIILDTDAGELQVHDGGTEYVQFKKDSSNVQITAGIQDGDIVFRGNDGGSMIEAARFDISNAGSLLIGKTAQNNTAAGTVIQTDGFASFVRDGNLSLILNRLTDDGTIVDFRKDGSTVGDIRCLASNLHIQGTTSGLSFQGNDVITPVKNGARTDNVIDLGDSSRRFKDLYLSGGLYVGGTGSANHLDDYEEGAWVPVFQNDGSTSYLHQLGKYVKVGSQVVATFHIDINSNNQIGSNQLKIENLPFTVANSNGQYGNVGGLHCNSWSTTTKPDNALAVPNTTRLEFYRSEGITGTSLVTGNDIGTGSLLGHVIFFTD